MTIRKHRAAPAAAALALAATILGYATQAHATAPGKNGRIVFRRYLDVEKTTSAIFTVNPDGTTTRQVTHPLPGVDDREPDWSPNGTKIGFERKLPCPAGGPKDGLNNTCDLVYTMTRDGKSLKSLVPCRFKVSADGSGTPGVDCVGVDDPAWSPDGSKIAFAYNLSNAAYTGSYRLDAGIWIVNADGSGLHQVTQRTPGGSWDAGPQWSPGGTKLVFYRVDLAADADAVFIANVDGTGELQVTPWELGGGDHPDWSPDGRWLLFRAQPADGSSNVYKVHPDGTELTNLTNEARDGHQYLSSGFSPDGTMITTSRTPGSGPEGAADVLVMNANGSHIRPVAKTRLWDSGTDWGTAPLR